MLLSHNRDEETETLKDFNQLLKVTQLGNDRVGIHLSLHASKA